MFQIILFVSNASCVLHSEDCNVCGEIFCRALNFDPHLHLGFVHTVKILTAWQNLEYDFSTEN